MTGSPAKASRSPTYYGQQRCTAGRAAVIGGNVPVRTGMTKVGLPGAKERWRKTEVTMALLKLLDDLGIADNTIVQYSTGYSCSCPCGRSPGSSS